MDLEPTWGVRGLDHLVDVRGTEVLAGIAKFPDATLIADVGVVNHQVRRLIFFMLCTGVIQVGQFVERKFAVALSGTDDVRLRAAVGRKTCKVTQTSMTGMVHISLVQAPSAGELLDARMKHS